MASKKLKVELEVDNSDAKKKAKEVAEAAAGARAAQPATPPPKPVEVPVATPKPVEVPVSPAAATPAAAPAQPPHTPSAVERANDRAAKSADRAADGLEKAGRSAQDLSNGAEESARSIKDIARSFAGLGIGMAMRFAHQFVKEGSTADKALTVGESAANLGVMGAKMGGITGAVIGTLVGAGAGAMNVGKADADRMKAETKQQAANFESIRSWERAREATLAFKTTLDALTDSETSLSDRRRMVAEEIKKREAEEEKLSMAQYRAAGNLKDPSALAKVTAERQTNAGRLDQLKELQKRLEKETPEAPRASFDAPDALSRIGGAFAPSGNDDMRELARTGKEQLAVLKSIDQKSGKDMSWQ